MPNLVKIGLMVHGGVNNQFVTIRQNLCYVQTLNLICNSCCVTQPHSCIYSIYLRSVMQKFYIVAPYNSKSKAKLIRQYFKQDTINVDRQHPVRRHNEELQRAANSAYNDTSYFMTLCQSGNIWLEDYKCYPHHIQSVFSYLTQSLQGTTVNNRIKLVSPETIQSPRDTFLPMTVYMCICIGLRRPLALQISTLLTHPKSWYSFVRKPEHANV